MINNECMQLYICVLAHILRLVVLFFYTISEWSHLHFGAFPNKTELSLFLSQYKVVISA